MSIFSSIFKFFFRKNLCIKYCFWSFSCARSLSLPPSVFLCLIFKYYFRTIMCLWGEKQEIKTRWNTQNMKIFGVNNKNICMYVCIERLTFQEINFEFRSSNHWWLNQLSLSIYFSLHIKRFWCLLIGDIKMDKLKSARQKCCKLYRAHYVC